MPAWAPTSGPIWEPGAAAPKLPRFATNPYSEWYWNTQRIDGSPTQHHHEKTYGRDHPYARFAETFNREIAGWQPDVWAELFRAAGARYAVLTTKHHDGFLLWPSEIRNPAAPDFVASRDLVGELTDAVRAEGLRMGLYYSGGIDWLWHDQVIAEARDFARVMPPGEEYASYATRHWKELIDRYGPCSMWNDITFPGPLANIEALFAYYYDRVPDGIVNDRWRMVPGKGGLEPALPHDVRTPEYTVVSDITAKKWESVRGIGNSFGFNRAEGADEYLSAAALVQSFVDIVSKNGNLLINVGPAADGAIPAIQVERLRALGAWLDAAGGAIYATRPWRRADGVTAGGRDVRFTAGREVLHAVVFDAAPNEELDIELPEVSAIENVEILGSDAPAKWTHRGSRLRVALGGALPTEHAVALRIRGPGLGI